MRLVFMGSPDLAVPSLEAAAQSGKLAGVITQPPRKKGRGQRTLPSPVAVRAKQMGITPVTPAEVKSGAFLELFARLKPDLAIVVAYGKILPAAVLAVPKMGCVNVHASLLPELRGAAPIQWAIARGHRKTGVTFMQMDEGMDTGPILMQAETAIGENEDAGSLAGRLSVMAADIIREGLPRLEQGRLTPVPQDDSAATFAPLLTKEDGRLDWQMSAVEICNRIRGFVPWPGVYTWFGGNRLIVTSAVPVDGVGGPPGTVAAATKDGIDVSAKSGILRILSLRPEGKREMTAEQFLAGRQISTGDKWGKEKNL